MAFPHDGKKFEKGTSGNPKGRPKLPDIKDLIEDVIGEEGMKEVLRAMFIKATKGKSEKAADILFDRGYGKAKQQLDVTTDGEKINQPIIQMLPPSDEVKSETK